jgi:hypothetical protein
MYFWGNAGVPTAIVTILILSLSPATTADAPLFGRPSAHYYDAVGENIRVEMSAVPTEIRVEQELTLTVRVRGASNPSQIRRPDLRTLDDFSNRFYIDDLDEGPAPVTSDRTFRYKLRPKNESVKEIPPLLFRYWQPLLQYFAATSPENAISLSVRVREFSEATATPLQGPEFLFQLTESDDTLEPTPGPTPVSGWEPIAIFFGPLLACLVWYIWWLRRNPGAAQMARFRRLRAVRTALDELHGLHGKPDHSVAGRIARLVRAYLHERWALPTSATTPSEIEFGLTKVSLPPGLIQHAVKFFRECDAAHFGALGHVSSSLAVEAERFIQALEQHAREVEDNPSRSAAIGACIIVAMVLTATGPSFANGIENIALPLIESANDAFRTAVTARNNEETAKPLFRIAARKFFKVRGTMLERDWLFRNEGHARTLSGDLPGAILVYREGLLHFPEDEILKRGLEYARSQVQYATPEDKMKLSPRIDRFARMKPTLRHLGFTISAVMAFAGWIGLTRWLMVRNRWYLVLGMCALGIAAGLTATRILEENRRNDEFAVSIASPVKPVVLRQGDGSSFLPARDTPLPPGVEVRVIQHRGTWIQVELADGTTGWLPLHDLLLNDRDIRRWTLPLDAD